MNHARTSIRIQNRLLAAVALNGQRVGDVQCAERQRERAIDRGREFNRIRPRLTVGGQDCFAQAGDVVRGADDVIQSIDGKNGQHRPRLERFNPILPTQTVAFFSQRSRRGPDNAGH